MARTYLLCLGVRRLCARARAARARVVLNATTPCQNLESDPFTWTTSSSNLLRLRVETRLDARTHRRLPRRSLRLPRSRAARPARPPRLRCHLIDKARRQRPPPRLVAAPRRTRARSRRAIAKVHPLRWSRRPRPLQRVPPSPTLSRLALLPTRSIRRSPSLASSHSDRSQRAHSRPF